MIWRRVGSSTSFPWKARCGAGTAINNRFLPSPAATLGQGLLTLPLRATEGLPCAQAETFGRENDTFSRLPLRQDLLHHPPRHVRQPDTPSVVLVGQSLVIQPEQVQERRV